jgi:hypothetical protein
LLELGGNNAIIVTPDADIKMTVSVLFLVLWKLTKMYITKTDHS